MLPLLGLPAASGERGAGCRACAPVGARFATYGAARAGAPDRADWAEAEAPVCSICVFPLDGPARGDEGASLEVEALFERLPQCGHAFHRACLKGWINAAQRNSTKCPVCSQPIHADVRQALGETRERTGSGAAARTVVLQMISRRLLRTEGSGITQLFEGDVGSERLARVVADDGTAQVYAGPRNAERITHIDHANGQQRDVYEGSRGQERCVRSEFPNGEQQFYEGSKGQERMVLHQVGNEIYNYYEGPRGQERLAERMDRLPNDRFTQTRFEGPRGEERVVRKMLEDGAHAFYEGPRGEERLVRARLAGGDQHFFEGPRHHERLVRAQTADGTEIPINARERQASPPAQRRRLER